MKDVYPKPGEEYIQVNGGRNARYWGNVKPAGDTGGMFINCMFMGSPPPTRWERVVSLVRRLLKAWRP